VSVERKSQGFKQGYLSKEREKLKGVEEDGQERKVRTTNRQYKGKIIT